VTRLDELAVVPVLLTPARACAADQRARRAAQRRHALARAAARLDDVRLGGSGRIAVVAG